MRSTHSVAFAEKNLPRRQIRGSGRGGRGGDVIVEVAVLAGLGGSGGKAWLKSEAEGWM